MKVRCINNQHADESLTMGQVYEVVISGDNYCCYAEWGSRTFHRERFQIVSERLNPSCGVPCAHYTDVHDCERCKKHIAFRCLPMCRTCPRRGLDGCRCARGERIAKHQARVAKIDEQVRNVIASKTGDDHYEEMVSEMEDAYVLHNYDRTEYLLRVIATYLEEMS